MKMYKNKGFQIVPVLLCLMALSSITSCKGFFSRSLFPGAARNPGDLVPPVTVKNVDELLRQGENNPDLALAVLRGIRDALGNASEDEANRLRAAAIKAAADAAALGSSILNSVGNISESMDQDKAIELLEKSLESMSNLSAAGDILAVVIPDPQTDKGAFDSFVGTAKADDLAMTSVILIAAEAKKQGGSVKDYIESLNSSGSLSAQESLAMKCAEAAAKKTEQGESFGSLKDILEGLNLI
jgi:hypothetical protein